MTSIPLSLYIHIPWCVRKCPYCDFNSHERRQEIDEQRYLDALISDLDDELTSIEGRTLSSIFIGGGTPSLMSASFYDQLLNRIRERIALDETIEITMEANPGTFEQESFAGFREAGIDRLSIGIQSFDNDHLESLGRIHDASQARNAIGIARQAGFENINIDLMFGLPSQTTESAVRDVETACDAGVEHISHYQLTLEPNTLFHKHPPELPDDETIWAMQDACHSRLLDAGYRRYEVSAFSKQERQCRHNLNYWQFGDYIGIGAGAHGKITDPEGRIERRWKHRHPITYMSAEGGSHLSGSQPIDTDTRTFEFLLNAFRLQEGFSLDDFEQRTGNRRHELMETLADIDDELIAINGERIRASERGYDLLNEILQRFI